MMDFTGCMSLTGLQLTCARASNKKSIDLSVYLLAGLGAARARASRPAEMGSAASAGTPTWPLGQQQEAFWVGAIKIPVEVSQPAC